MKLWMRIAMPVATVMTFAVSAHAQQWGSGYYGGMQACPYEYGAAEGSSDIQDEIYEEQDAIKEAKYQLKLKKSELKSAERLATRHRATVEEVVAADYTTQIFSHIDNTMKACEYKGLAEVQVQGNQGGVPIPTCGSLPSDKEVSGFTVDQWKGLVSNTPGVVNGRVCNDFRVSEKGRRTVQDCQKALVEYKKENDKKSKLTSEIDALLNSIDSMKENIARLRKDAREEARDAARERRENPEGNICPDGNCGRRSAGNSGNNTGAAITNIALGALAIGGGIYMGNKSIDAAANLGFPMDPYQTYGMGLGLGLPFAASGVSQLLGGNGLYGTVAGGVGAGAYGCAGNNGGPYGMMGPYGGANGQGMWGNPYGMNGMNPYGGGMYAPGMGPWGMNGPMGGMMGGYPGGMMMSGGGGIMMGGMMPGMMMGGMSGGMMPGMMSGGMMPGMMMSGGGGIMMGGMMPGTMMGGMAGGMMPGMMMGGMAGGMMPGMMMGGMSGGMMPGMMMGGMAGGMMPGMMMGGMAGGMMPGMMSGGMMGGDLGAFQMQQQMMQMQMNQYQQMMQQQMQKQQVTAGLQQELYGLMYRIQQVQYGFGSNYLSGGIGGNSGFGSGVIPAPGYGGGYNNGGYGTGTGVLPAPGYNNGSGTGNGGVILAPR
jgi:hypothetical protein